MAAGAAGPPSRPVPPPQPGSGPNSALAKRLHELRRLAASLVRGQERAIDDFLLCAAARGHLLILGVPGTGKTMLAKVLGRLTGLESGRVQFTQDLLPSDVTGHFVLDRTENKFVLRRGPVFCNILLADEINRAPTKTQSALLESMEEHQVTIEGRTFPLPEPFVVVATMNPIDLEGVHHLPAAQLDRFTIQTRVDYPDANQEQAMLADPPARRFHQIPSLGSDLLPALRERTLQVRVHKDAMEYLVRLVRGSRTDPDVLLGVSPRATQQTLDVARAWAVLNGRDYVVPRDLQVAFTRCASHRIHLRPEATGTMPDDVAARIIAATPTPELR